MKKQCANEEIKRLAEKLDLKNVDSGILHYPPRLKFLSIFNYERVLDFDIENFGIGKILINNWGHLCYVKGFFGDDNIVVSFGKTSYLINNNTRQTAMHGYIYNCKTK